MKFYTKTRLVLV